MDEGSELVDDRSANAISCRSENVSAPVAATNSCTSGRSVQNASSGDLAGGHRIIPAMATMNTVEQAAASSTRSKIVGMWSPCVGSAKAGLKIEGRHSRRP
jgi:hypothetical protein